MSEVTSFSGAPPRTLTVDASRRDLSKVSQVSTITKERLRIAALNLDDNNLSTLHGIKEFPSLIQLSVTGNSLVRMEAVAPLLNLVSLNLQNNSLSEISGLERLVNLEWLCLAGNSIKSMDGLTTNGKMNHLDISDNCISEFTNISMLKHLKTLLLHGNAISSLQSVKENIPGSLNTLSLAENEVADLNEVSFLSSLKSLSQLSIMSNPCVSLTDSGVFDYRPFVCYWCPGVTTLDGYPVTNLERQCSTTLFPTTQPCPFTVGQHQELIHYLYSVSPLHTAQLLNAHQNGDATDYSTLMSMSSLEDSVLKRYAQSVASDPKQADILEKLRALQVVEDMIKTQEHLLTGRTETPADNNANNLLDLDVVTLEGATKTSDSPPKPVVHVWTASARNSSLSPTPGPVVSIEERVTEQTDSETTPLVKKTSATEDKKVEQLKQLNAKLAQRHSKVVQKSGKSLTAAKRVTKANAESSKFKKMARPNKQGLQSGKSMRTPGDNQHSLKSKELMQPKSKHSNSVTTTATKSSKKPSTSKFKSEPKKSHLPENFPKVHLPGVPIYPSDTGSDLPVSKPDNMTQVTPSKHESLISVAATSMPAPYTSVVLDSEADMLDSTSYYFPVSEDVFSDSTLASQFEAALEQDSQCGSSLLVSSLTQAYGMSGLTETSELLSTLQTQNQNQPATHNSGLTPRTTIIHKSQVEVVQDSENNTVSEHLAVVDGNPLSPSVAPYQPVKTNVPVQVKREHSMIQNKAATQIQAAWRGYRARCCDPEVIRVRSELSKIKLEAVVAENVAHLQGCRQELAHQSQMLQLQEETLQTLLKEVEVLRLWKAKVEAKEKQNAAIVIQKSWRGHRARKNYRFQSRGVSLSRIDALWALCLSLEGKVAEMWSMLARDKRVRFKKDEFLDVPGDHPPPSDLKMSHFSVSCILLRWTPACTPLHPDVTTLKCYRVYVNGEVEGMVGSEKCKAYIEGLVADTTYRITVRAVYNTGESDDSNPVVASLNSNKSALTSSHSPHNSNSDSSDEEARHTDKRSMGEFPEYPQKQPEDPNQSRDQPDISASPDQNKHETTTYSSGTIEQNKANEPFNRVQTDSHDQAICLGTSVAIENKSSQPELLEQQNVELEPSYHFLKAKHITADTVSVLSGCTIEYSSPAAQASNSADTLKGESSLEFDVHNSDSSESSSASTNVGMCSTEGNNKQEEKTQIESTVTNEAIETNGTTCKSREFEDNGQSNEGPKPSKQQNVDCEQSLMLSDASSKDQLEVEHITNVLSTCPQETPCDMFAISHVTTTQTTSSFVDDSLKMPIHEMSLPLSEHSSHMLPPVSSVADEQMLTTFIPHDLESVERPSLDNMPFQVMSDSNPCSLSQKTMNDLSFQAHKINEIHPHHKNFEVISKATAMNIPGMTVTSVVGSKSASALTLHSSNVVPSQQSASNADQFSPDKDIQMGCKITEAKVKEKHQNKQSGSNFEKPADGSQTKNCLQEPSLTANPNTDSVEGLDKSCEQVQHPSSEVSSLIDDHKANLPVIRVLKTDPLPIKEKGHIEPTISTEQESSHRAQNSNYSS